MSETENMELVLRFDEEVFGRQNLGLADTLLAPQFKNYTAPPRMQDGTDGSKARCACLSRRSRTTATTSEDIFAAADRVAVGTDTTARATARTWVCHQPASMSASRRSTSSMLWWQKVLEEKRASALDDLIG